MISRHAGIVRIFPANGERGWRRLVVLFFRHGYSGRDASGAPAGRARHGGGTGNWIMDQCTGCAERGRLGGLTNATDTSRRLAASRRSLSARTRGKTRQPAMNNTQEAGGRPEKGQRRCQTAEPIPPSRRKRSNINRVTGRRRVEPHARACPGGVPLRRPPDQIGPAGRWVLVGCRWRLVTL